MPDTVEEPCVSGRVETLAAYFRRLLSLPPVSLPYEAPAFSGFTRVCVCVCDVGGCGCRSGAVAAPSLSMPTSCQSRFCRGLPPSPLPSPAACGRIRCEMTLVRRAAGLGHAVWDSGYMLNLSLWSRNLKGLILLLGVCLFVLSCNIID